MEMENLLWRHVMGEAERRGERWQACTNANVKAKIQAISSDIHFTLDQKHFLQ